VLSFATHETDHFDADDDEASSLSMIV